MILLLSLALLGCKTECLPVVHLADTNNYTYSGTLDVPSIVTASGTDIRICWDQVTQDLQCHDLDPAADINMVSVVRFSTLTQAEVEAGLAADDLLQADISGYVTWENGEGATCVDLSSLSFFGTPIDMESEYVEGAGTFLFLLSTGTDIGMGTRVLAFLEPTQSSDATEVDVPDGCGTLDFSASLTTLEPVPICAVGPWTVDWSELTRDGQDYEFQASTVDSLLLARYDGLTATDLEARFLDLELLATETWTLDLPGGTSAELAGAVSPLDGSLFSGFDLESTWGFALRCSRCYNPAPPFVTLLEPQE